MARKMHLCIDLDGTLTEDSWPKMGEWLPGAREALRELSTFATIEVDSCRMNPYEQGKDAIQLRPNEVYVASINETRALLDSEGFQHVRLHTTLGKPSADHYIDNKAIAYLGRPKSWEKIVETLKMRGGVAL